MSVETTVAQAANAAEAAAAAATEAAGAATVDAAIATANEAVARAETVSAEIAAAAMETVRGRELAELCEDFDEWREESETRLTALETQIAETLAGITSMQAALETLKASLATTIVVTPPAAGESSGLSTLEPSAETPAAIVATVEPGEAPAVEAVPLAAATRRKAARFIG